MQDNKNLLSSEELSFPKSDRIIYDWISISTRKHNPGEIMDLLGMRDCPWEIMTSGNGYTHRHFFGDVSISFCSGDMSHVNGFYLFEMSGQGCRTFETYGNGDYAKLFSLVQAESCKPAIDRDVRITRLDVAYDDMSGLFDIDLICDKTRLGHFVSRIQRYESIYGSKGNSVNFGSKGSNVFIRIYDKARERGFTDGRHWIRCELQLRKDNAFGFVVNLPKRGLSDMYRGVLKNYLSFREPDDSDSNKRRWEESAWWTKFIDGIQAISVAEKPGVIYNLNSCEKYVLTQPVGSLQTLIKIHGSDAVIEMINSAPAPKNPKYRRLVAQVMQERSAAVFIDGSRAVTCDSDDAIVAMSEFADELRGEYDQISRDASEKRISSKRERDRKSSIDFLKKHGIDISGN